MTPRQYLDQLHGLISAGREQDALDLSDRVGDELRPRMTLDELGILESLMESALTQLDLRCWQETRANQATAAAEMAGG